MSSSFSMTDCDPDFSVIWDLASSLDFDFSDSIFQFDDSNLCSNSDAIEYNISRSSLTSSLVGLMTRTVVGVSTAVQDNAALAEQT